MLVAGLAAAVLGGTAWADGRIGPEASSKPAGAEAGATVRGVKLATLVWPPYVGPQLPEEGLAAVVAAAVVRQFDEPLEIEFLPWKRAMQVGSEDAAYAGYFPAYYSVERARACHFTQPMGHSVLGLATLRDEPLAWEKLADLAGVPIGVVSGYSNGPEFDTMVHEGRLQVDASPTDGINLRKLLAHRVRAVAIDATVLRYLLLTDPMLVADRDRIIMNPRPIADLSLHVCFQRTPHGLKLQQLFDVALRRLDLPRIEAAYFQQLGAARPAASAPR